MRKFVLFSTLLIVILISSSSVFASNLDLSNWMTNVNGNLYLSELSIPGSHESCATEGVKIPIVNKDYGKCQEYSVNEQLNMGVRFLDIRCKSSDDGSNLAIHHGSIYQNLMFGDVLNQCQNFLRNHPGETILMRIKQEHSSVSDAVFKNAFLSYVSKYPNLFWDNNQKNMDDVRLKETRGKIVVLYNLEGLNFGLDYSHFFRIQDEYELSNAAEKEKYIQNSLNEADNWRNLSHPTINYASAQGNASHTPEDLANQINPWLERVLDANVSKHTGIIAMDFVRSQINEKIIEKNYSNRIQFRGLGDYIFANFLIKDNKLIINYQTESAHSYFNNRIYASCFVYNRSNLRYIFRGNYSYEEYEYKTEIKEGDLLAFYHAEPSRLISSLNSNLNENKVIFYRFSGGILKEESPDIISMPNIILRQKLNESLNKEVINGREDRDKEDRLIKQDLINLNSLNISNAQITDLSGLEHAINLTSLDISSNNLSSGDIKAINSLSRLTTLNLKDTQLSQDQISQLSLSPSLNHLDLSNNHLYDLTALKGSATSCDLGNQIIAEKEQRAPNGSFKYPMKQIKNRDGSTPKISCNNGGVYDESTGTISWKNLPSDVKEVSYSWIGQDGFSGTVKIPISYIKESDDWGISVPAAIKLNNYGSVASVSYRDTYSVFYGTGRVKIVQKDGSDYPDDAKSFVISAQATKFATTEGNKTTWYSLKHENSEPDKSSSLGNLDNSWLRSERNGTLEFNSNSRSEWLSFFVKYQDLIGTGTLHADCSGTISWSATEK
ncbi:phosphatidylinositol-specific phospholipase C domain-containing protein [Lactococcus lactis]